MEEKKIPMRRCVGCMKSYPQSTLIRITCCGDSLSIDGGRRNEGRGVYLCRSEECVNKARKTRAFNRSFRKQFSDCATEAVLEEVLRKCKEVANG